MDYLVNTRRELHKIPEIGFDLDKTLAFVRAELDRMGVEYTEKYGKSSIVAYLGKRDAGRTIAIRADMDALPISEANDIPYKSLHEGAMHACGHDAHTTIALDTVRRLKELEDTLTCEVRVIFQSAEEYTTSGALLMIEAGVLEGVDMAIALHVDPTYDAGCVGISSGRQNAISYGFYLDFYGKSVHVARQSEGVDAIKMAMTAYNEINRARDEFEGDELIFGCGAVEGGKTNNIVCDKCRMFCTVRATSNAAYFAFDKKMREIVDRVASEAGGKGLVFPIKLYPLVINDEGVTERARETLLTTIDEEKIINKIPDMIGEDFGYFSAYCPSCMIRLGIKNEALGITHPLHNEHFNIDESAMTIGSDFFVNFVINNMIS